MKPSGIFMVVFYLLPLPAAVGATEHADWLQFALGLWVGGWIFGGWLLLANRDARDEG